VLLINSSLNALLRLCRGTGLAFILVASLLGKPIGTRADTSATASAPIQILKCSVNQNRAYVDPYQAISIAFVDRGDVSADEVKFAITYAGHAAVLRDSGVFSKDATIDHAYKAFWGMRFEGPTPSACIIEYVHFRDGSSWTL
jgi:hypothetical protein